ncbi:hypothetical protein D3C78_1075140 [compost metagenome]
MAEVGRPPVLRVGHQSDQIGLEGLVVELLELFGVVELLAERIGLVRMLVEQIHAKLVGPPVPIGGATSSDMIERAFSFIRHYFLLCPHQVERIDCGRIEEA